MSTTGRENQTTGQNAAPLTAIRRANIVFRAVLIYAGVMAPFAVAVLTVRGLFPGATVLPWFAGVTFAALVAAIAWSIRNRMEGLWSLLATRLVSINKWAWFLGCISIGLILRLAWVWFFPAAPSSDGAIYINLTKEILAGHPYAMAGSRAYWPPGYPIFLAPWVWAFNDATTAVIASNLFLFLVGAVGVLRLASVVIDPAGARLALALFILWPNLVFQAGIPEKEQVLVALVPWILALAISRASWTSLPTGIVLGISTLVQPALQLFPVVLIATWYLSNGNGFSRQLFGRFVMLLLGMVLVISPWTIRNYNVFGEFVLISTNGGYGLYGANNEWATGGYLDKTPVDLSQLPEVDADREGKRQGFAWIKSHPAQFVALAFEKNVRFMGDDAFGAYQTLRRGSAPLGEAYYLLFKGIANSYWLFVWGIILAGLFLGWRHGPQWSGPALGVPVAFCYSFGLHSIVESSGKYHILMIGLVCLIVPLCLSAATRNAKSQRGGMGQPFALSSPSRREDSLATHQSISMTQDSFIPTTVVRHAIP